MIAGKELTVGDGLPGLFTHGHKVRMVGQEIILPIFLIYREQQANWLALVGDDTEQAAYALVKRIPSPARRSMFGVL